jgi:hypothetical protein
LGGGGKGGGGQQWLNECDSENKNQPVCVL